MGKKKNYVHCYFYCELKSIPKKKQNIETIKQGRELYTYNSLNVIHASISGQAESCLQATHTQPNPKERKNKGMISNFSTRILPFVICLFACK